MKDGNYFIRNKCAFFRFRNNGRIKLQQLQLKVQTDFWRVQQQKRNETYMCIVYTIQEMLKHFEIGKS